MYRELLGRMTNDRDCDMMLGVSPVPEQQKNDSAWISSKSSLSLPSEPKSPFSWRERMRAFGYSNYRCAGVSGQGEEDIGTLGLALMVYKALVCCRLRWL